jgi:5-formaminoimidazole-4-carboxamide-1-beta-D-ribofuranosyl 5'-monophosphate synthetase
MDDCSSNFERTADDKFINSLKNMQISGMTESFPLREINRHIGQLVVYLAVNEIVAGSIPAMPAKNYSHLLIEVDFIIEIVKQAIAL